MDETRELMVLDAVDDFDAFGGASRELIAWELDLAPAELRDLWTRLIDEQLLGPAGVDDILGEDMYRLSDAGRAALLGRHRNGGAAA